MVRLIILPLQKGQTKLAGNFNPHCYPRVMCCPFAIIAALSRERDKSAKIASIVHEVWAFSARGLWCAAHRRPASSMEIPTC